MLADGDVRLHFLDWGGPAATAGTVPAAPGAAPAGMVLGAGRPAAACAGAGRWSRTCAVTASPTRRLDGYDLDTLAADAIAVAEGAGLLAARAADRWPATGSGRSSRPPPPPGSGDRCAGPRAGGRRLGAPRGDHRRWTWTSSCAASTSRRRCCGRWPPTSADRRAFDPATWDADQERAARDAVVETAAGHVVRAVRPHVVEAVVRTMFAYEPGGGPGGGLGARDRARRPGRGRPADGRGSRSCAGRPRRTVPPGGRPSASPASRPTPTTSCAIGRPR